MHTILFHRVQIFNIDSIEKRHHQLVFFTMAQIQEGIPIGGAIFSPIYLHELKLAKICSGFCFNGTIYTTFYSQKAFLFHKVLT